MNLSASHLSKVFQGRGGSRIKALAEVSMNLPTGRFYTILGENGAGKTTLLRLLAGLLKPTSGSFSMCEFQSGGDLRRLRAGVGYLSAGTGLYDRLSPRELVSFFGKLHEIERPTLKGRVERLFRRLGVIEYQDQLCGQLSTGMSQKVSLARALVHEPDFLLLDEPFESIDILARKTIAEMLKELVKAGKTVLCSAHRVEDIEPLCDHVLIFARGRLIVNAPFPNIQREHDGRTLAEIFVRVMEERNQRNAAGKDHAAVRC